MQNQPQNQNYLWKELLQPEILAKLNCVYGISIPFIVGAYYRKGLIKPEDMCSSHCIRIVFEDIRSEKANNVIVEDCVKAYKEEIEDVEKIVIIKNGHANISDTVIYGLKVFEFNEFIDLMWSKYHTQIIQSVFSYDNDLRDWRIFTQNEEDTIDTLII